MSLIDAGGDLKTYTIGSNPSAEINIPISEFRGLGLDGGATPVISWKPLGTARVRIDSENRYLHMREVQVFDRNDVRVPLTGSAAQQANNFTFNGFPYLASYAVDGNLNTFSHTGKYHISTCECSKYRFHLN